MASNFSRRSFLGGFLAGVAAFLGHKAPKAPAAPPPPVAPPPLLTRVRSDRLGSVTTYVYDGCDRIVSITDPLCQIATYTYDGLGRRIGEQ
jgi:YD repeat-containing protein